MHALITCDCILSPLYLSLSLTVFPFRPHSLNFPKNLSPVCVCVCAPVCSGRFSLRGGCIFLAPVFISTVGSMHILPSPRPSKNPLVWMRKQRSVHSGTCVLGVYSREGMGFLCILYAHGWTAFQSGAWATAAVFSFSDRVRITMEDTVITPHYGKLKKHASVILIFTPLLFSVLSRSGWSRKRVDYKERGRKRAREGTFEVFHIDLIRQQNRTLQLRVSWWNM